MEYIGLMKRTDGQHPTHLFFVRATGPTSEDAIRHIKERYPNQGLLALSPMPELLNSGPRSLAAAYAVRPVVTEVQVRATSSQYVQEIG